MSDHRSSQENTTPPPASPSPALPPPAAYSTEPHGSHEELQHHPSAASIGGAPGPPPAATTSLRKPVPPVPISVPTPAHLHESPTQMPASAPQTPSILRMPSPNLSASAGSAHQEAGNATAGPSNIPQQKRRVSPHHSSEEDNAVSTPRSGSIPVPQQPQSASTQGFGSGFGGNNGLTVPTPAPSIRHPTRAASNGHRPMHARTVTLTEPILPMPGGLSGELNPTGHVSRHSIIDHVVPSMPAANIPAPSVAGTNGQRRRSMAAYSQSGSTLSGEKCVADRLDPTLKAAMAERDKAALKAKVHAWALNVAIGAQVVLGALTTGVAAAVSSKRASIATSILGGMSTLAASYLAKARGSGEPEVSSIRRRDLDGFIRDIEAFMLDKGYVVGPEYDTRIERYRRRFEEIMGVGSGGVGDQVPRAQMQMQQMQQMAKTASPV